MKKTVWCVVARFATLGQRADGVIIAGGRSSSAVACQHTKKVREGQRGFIRQENKPRCHGYVVRLRFPTLHSPHIPTLVS
jgi:hypothetical protein